MIAAVFGGVATIAAIVFWPQPTPHRLQALLPEGMVASEVEIRPTARTGEFILPNDRVDVVLERSGGSASETILRNVRVLAIDQDIGEKNGQKIVLKRIAILQVSQAESVALKRSTALGGLDLVLRSISDADADSKDGRK